MGHRSTILLLLFSYIAGQLATLPHAHSHDANHQHSGHEQRPHVHLTCFGHGGHSHGRESGHYHGDGEPHPHHSTDDKLDVAGGHSTGHDSDAVYLPDGADGVSLVVKSVSSIDVAHLTLCLPPPLGVRTPDATAEVKYARNPGECSPGRPLFIALRALRI